MVDNGSQRFHIIFRVHLSEAFFLCLQALEGDDIRLVVEEYQRSYEQNEELGLLDMNTDNY